MDIKQIQIKDMDVQEYATYILTHGNNITQIFLPIYQYHGKNCKWITFDLIGKGEINPFYESANQLTAFLRSITPYSFEDKLYEVYFENGEHLSFTLKNKVELESTLKTHSTLKGCKITATKSAVRKPSVRKTVRKPATRKVKRA